ncbi:hypothetical protein GVN16_00145 [Emticicia sp. CRIBPO]|uniref:hypothetical protein n=1 Tax=Emticicia sp. CRIBPO TaxID=2683258 RepID=UPI00141211B6|nr:hypothetical protein [Emticicia sp. CRIBPO]NBA84147.1 hypothetical protein [Emticicia sp. CRIBPO]
MKKLFIISGILFTFFFSSGFGIGENNNVAKKEISQRQTLRQTQTAESQAFISEKLNEAAQSEEKAIDQKSIAQSVGTFFKEITITITKTVFQVIRSLFF